MPQVFSWSDDEFDDRARGLAALIRRVWRAIARQVAANVEQQKAITMAAASPIPAQWQQAVDDQIVGFVRNVYLDAAGGISDALNAPDELLVGDDLVEVYTNAARNRLVGIGDDVWKNVQAQITLGNQLGEGIPEIAERIRNVAGVSEARSLTIARTEVHAAFESGSYEQAMFVDPKGEKVWLATEDERTRPSHRAADGQRVKIGESFDVGGSKLRFPGDPLGAPEDCINCRCSVAYDFDMITTVVEEPEPAMVAAGEQMWKAHQHPRGNDGKFIKSGIVADFLKKSSPNIIDVSKAVGNLDGAQWDKLTDAQKTHIKSSVDKLPKGTATHNQAQKTLDSFEKIATDTPSPKPKTKIGETYAKLKDAKHGDVLATGTKYNSAGVGQKFRITADKTHVHPDYVPYGKMKLEFLKKNGEPSGQSYSSDILGISQKLHPLPVKGKKPGKVEWDEPGTTAPSQVTPSVDAPDFAPNPPKPGPKVITTETKIPAGLKGAPGDPAKITTGVVWGKHPAGTTIVQSEDGMDRIVWNGKKYEFQSQDDIGDWAKQFEMSKKDFYAQHKEDTAWKIPGGETTPAPFVPDADALEKAYNPDDDGNTPSPLSDEALGHEPTPDDVDFYVTQWERENGFSTDKETGQLLDDVLGPETTPEPPQTPSTPPVPVAPYLAAPDPSKLFDTGQELGSHGARVFKDEQGNNWLFKSQPKFATNMDVGASELQRRAGRPSPETYAITLSNGDSGSIQHMLDGTGDFGYPGSFDATNLTPAQRREVLREQPLDWLVSNFDAHSENFINLPNGQVLAIDKGNGLKFFGQDSLTDYHWRPNEHRTVYSHLWRDYAAGKYDITSEDLKALSESIDKLQAISDDDLKEMFRPYAEDVNKKGWLLTAKSNPWAENLKPRTVKSGDVDAFLNALVARKKALKADFESLYAKATDDRNGSPDIGKKSLLAPELSPGTGPVTPIKDSDTPAAPDAASAKAKLKKLWDKGLITQQEYVDATGENSDGSDPYGGVADKGVLLNDLESGAILPMPQAIDLGIMLNESDYNDLSNMEKDQLETTLSTAADMDMLGGKDAYAHWQSLHSTPSADTSTDDHALPVADGPMISGSSLGLKDLHNLIVNGKHAGKYTDGQVVAVSPDGTKQIVHRASLNGYVMRFTDTGTESFMNNISTIKKIRSDDFHVPESLLPNHGGTLVPNLVEPGPNDPLTNDVDSIGVTNGQALLALHHGDTDKLVTIDGTWEIYKSPNGKWTALKQNHPDDTATITLLDDNDTADLDKTAGPQVWYPQDAIDSAKASTSGTAGQPLDPDVIQEKIDLGEYTAGEVVAVTEDGQHQLIYSPIVNGLVYQFKVGNTGNLDLDWDTDKVYDGNADTMDTPISEFVEDHPDVKLFEPQDVNVSGDDDPNVTNWDPILSGPYVLNDVVAEAGGNGKWQLVDKDNDEYALYKKDNATGQYNLVSMHSIEDLYDLTLPDDASWRKVNAGTKFKSGKFPAKKAFAKKVAKAAGVPQTYSAAAVTPGEKKFYLDDAEDGALVPAEVIHLLNGAGGLDFSDVKKLTPKQVANIDKQVAKALDAGMAGSGSASLEWSDLKTDITSPSLSQTVDMNYLIDMEDEMWSGDKEFGDIIAVTADGKYRLMIHSTEGPGENPDSFAVEVNGPYGWEVTNVYSGNPPTKFWDDWHEKPWVIPDSNDDGSGAPDDVLDSASVEFDPPGHGTQLPGTIFDMLSWVPEGKTLLVGKDDNGDKFKMVAGKSPSGAKVINVDLWHPSTGTFNGWAQFHNEQEYNDYNDDNIKWDTPGVLPDKSALDDYMGNPDSPDANAPIAPTAPLLPLTSDNVDAIWDKIQTLDIGTVIGTTTGTYGKDRRMLVGLSNTGEKIPVVQQKNDSDTWIKWNDVSKIGLEWELADYTWTSEIHDTPTPSAPVLDSGNKLTPSHSKSLWDAVQNLDEDTVVATAVSKNGSPIQMVVKKHAEGHSILSVQKKHPVSGKWGWWYSITDEDHLSDDLGEEDWHNEIDVPDVNAPGTPSAPTAPTAGSNIPTAPAPTAPGAPSVSTPPAVKPVPLYKINILKGNMKTDGNVGYWSKPEKIWEQIQKFQKLPGNENFSPIDFLTALDSTLKTDKHSYVAKMTKWAATKKGAQTIGAGGIGPTPSAPSASSSSTNPHEMPDFTPGNSKVIWDKIQNLPNGTVVAHLDGTIPRRLVVKGNNPKYLEVQAWSPADDSYTHYGAYTSHVALSNGLISLKYTPGTSGAGAAATKTTAKIPDIEAGSDISGIDAVKQKQAYDAFKANPGTYLNSSQAFENFDAFQSVAKSEGLTLGQVINIVDEQGAIKVSKPNEGLFKKKIADWLKTPEAAAHILSEPKKVTGLPTPPEFTPEYHPDLHLPSFEQSSKYTYDYVQTTHAATKIWKDITAKTKPYSSSEESALKVWTGGAYSSINGHLYAPSSPYSSLSSTHKIAMKGAQKGMRPSDRPMVLVRGTYFDGLGNAKNHQQLEKLVGTTWRNNAFAATSVGQAPKDPPGVYAPAFSSLPLWIEFECPPGTPMSWVATFSQHGHEREMLLAADLHYQILSVEKKSIPGYGVKSVARVRIVPKPEGAAE